MSLLTSRPWRIVSFNVENLFLYFDAPLSESQRAEMKTMTESQWRSLSTSTVPNKPLSQVRDIARAIEDLDPDFLLLSEVGGRESLANFSQYFLGGRYAPHLVEGNSDRGIDLGFLVRRGLPLKYDMVSHKGRKLDFEYPHEKLTRETGFTHLRSGRAKVHRFSRDVVELRCFRDGADAEVADGLPEFVLMLVHLKSPLDRDRIDPGGRDRRKAEFDKLMEIYREVRTEVGAAVPVLIGGDFNGVVAGAKPDAEFEALKDTDLRCCLDLAEIPVDERFTWMHLHNRRPGLYRQIDFLLVPESLGPSIDREHTWVYRFKDELGMNRIIPRNANEKRLLPSDHYPVVLTLRPTSNHSPQNE